MIQSIKVRNLINCQVYISSNFDIGNIALARSGTTVLFVEMVNAQVSGMCSMLSKLYNFKMCNLCRCHNASQSHLSDLCISPNTDFDEKHGLSI